MDVALSLFVLLNYCCGLFVLENAVLLELSISAKRIERNNNHLRPEKKHLTSTRHCIVGGCKCLTFSIIPYPTAFPYGNGMVLHFYQQQESSTTKTVHKVINKGLKTYV